MIPNLSCLASTKSSSN